LGGNSNENINSETVEKNLKLAFAPRLILSLGGYRESWSCKPVGLSQHKETRGFVALRDRLISGQDAKEMCWFGGRRADRLVGISIAKTHWKFIMKRCWFCTKTKFIAKTKQQF
jgi:hypothetical protein